MAASKAPRREDSVLRVLVVVLALNVAVAALKLGVGLHIGALSLVADGLHSVLDGASNVVGIVGIAIASRPADAGHPYGHRRFETLAAAFIGILIGAGFIELIKAVVAGLVHGVAAPRLSPLAVLAVVGTVVVNIFISRYERRRSRELQSSILEADSEHTLSDALAATVVLVGFAGSWLGLPYADLVAALFVSGFVAMTAFRLLKDNMMVLSDAAQLDPEEVERVALSVDGVKAAHRIRSRGSREAVHLDLHIHVSPELRVTQAHALTHQVAATLQAHFPAVDDVVIHTEPSDYDPVQR